eukprot:6028467-Ditylum_brightwellii.AAC.1
MSHPPMQSSTMYQSLENILCIPPKDTPIKKVEKTTVINEFKIKLTFIVPKHGNIKPCEKNTFLLLLIVAKLPTTMLKEWEGTEMDQCQSITFRQDLPHEKLQT